MVNEARITIFPRLLKVENMVTPDGPKVTPNASQVNDNVQLVLDSTTMAPDAASGLIILSFEF